MEQKKQAGLYRRFKQQEGLDFTSNDYLNLSQNREIKKALIKALKKKEVGLSAKASRLLGGNSPLHQKTESQLAQFINRPASLCFSSGYQANLGLIPALAKGGVVFSDELNHASLIDGIRLSQQPYHIFRHNDLNHLEDLLKKETQKKLIITESLFSMTGDFSPLKELSCLALKYQALLIVDEAHSTGLFGKNLNGLVSELKHKQHIVSLHTGGKALASYGAFVGSSVLVKNYLINNCRSFIYSTAPPPLLMLQWLATLKVLKTQKKQALKLRKKALWLKKNLSLTKNPSPIVFIVLKGAKQALNTAKKLRAKGFFVQAVRKPTVPENAQGLRIILHSNHSLKHIKTLKQELEKLLNK